MATSSTALLNCLEKGSVPKSKRKLQKHLRSAGLAYISRTGKLIPAKKVAGELKKSIVKCLLCCDYLENLYIVIIEGQFVTNFLLFFEEKL